MDQTTSARHVAGGFGIVGRKTGAAWPRMPGDSRCAFTNSWRSGRLLVLEPADLVLDPEFLALQFGDFGIGRSRMVKGFGEFIFEGLMFGLKFTKVRLKTHAILRSGYVTNR